jgi:hypothetical protein
MVRISSHAADEDAAFIRFFHADEPRLFDPPDRQRFGELSRVQASLLGKARLTKPSHDSAPSDLEGTATWTYAKARPKGSGYLKQTARRRDSLICDLDLIRLRVQSSECGGDTP